MANLSKKVQVARLSIVSNTVLTAGKLVAGLSTNSISILSEALHSSLDLVAALIAYFAVWKSGQPPDERHQFGHGKYENVACILEALLIVGAAVTIIAGAIPKLRTPHHIESLGLGAGIMAISVVANLFVSQRLFRVARETDSPALAGDAWHLRTDVYTSLGVFGGLVAIHLTGLTILDPLIALVIASIILKAAFDLIRNSMQSILDVKLPDEDLRIIKDVLQKYEPDVVGFHALRTRKSGPYRFIELHLVTPSRNQVKDVHHLCDRIELDIIARLPRSEVTIHIEPCDDQCVICSRCPQKQD